MANPHGTPIWYEIATKDPATTKAFYEAVAPWTIGEAAEGSPVDYRMIDTGGGDFAGGLANLSGDDAPGMAPGWKFYIGVDDVDAAAEAVTAAGGMVTMPPFDLEGVGRMALVADPQGNPFYIMRGASPEDSTVFARGGEMGKCSWNELATSDAEGGNAFYAKVFGWTYPDRMPMGEMGDYTFIDCAGQALGATMKAGMPGQPTGWQFYFRVPDIDAAAAAVTANGGAVHMGPMEVPGGERIIVASDPAGTVVGFVAGQEEAA
jgi:uncharacterized protein